MIDHSFRILTNIKLKAISFLLRNRVYFLFGKLTSRAEMFQTSGINSKIVLGKGCVLSSGVSLEAFSGDILSFGQGVFLNNGVVIACKDSIHIGSKTTIGPYAIIYDHTISC